MSVILEARSTHLALVKILTNIIPRLSSVVTKKHEIFGKFVTSQSLIMHFPLMCSSMSSNTLRKIILSVSLLGEGSLSACATSSCTSVHQIGGGFFLGGRAHIQLSQFGKQKNELERHDVLCSSRSAWHRTWRSGQDTRPSLREDVDPGHVKFTCESIHQWVRILSTGDPRGPHLECRDEA